MKTFPINLCRRELSTFPPSPAKDSLFLCDELVQDYPAEIFGFEVNLQHHSRSGLEMDPGWAGSASRAAQDSLNPQPGWQSQLRVSQGGHLRNDLGNQLSACVSPSVPGGGCCSSHWIRTPLAQTSSVGFWPALPALFSGRFLAP